MMMRGKLGPTIVCLLKSPNLGEGCGMLNYTIGIITPTFQSLNQRENKEVK